MKPPIEPGHQPVDILAPDGTPTGEQATLDHAASHGLPFGSVHVLVYTADGHVLVQKRSRTIIFAPGRLDYGVGGVMNAGETPAAAAVRELREETGISAKQSQLSPLGTTPYHHRWPRYHRHLRVFTHSYLLKLPAVPAHLTLQPSEVDDAWFISLAQARQLLRRHTLSRLGRLLGRYSYYGWLLHQLPHRPS
ncbi:MAG TPA: NUDIX domain-containing protein [Candidatus Saccharimonas sp.]|nr:NUDIX domain-containing protein [Candidatus Saccharimonas sp.]